jgi:hypothetical protein
MERGKNSSINNAYKKKLDIHNNYRSICVLPIASTFRRRFPAMFPGMTEVLCVCKSQEREYTIGNVLLKEAMFSHETSMRDGIKD